MRWFYCSLSIQWFDMVGMKRFKYCLKKYIIEKFLYSLQSSSLHHGMSSKSCILLNLMILMHIKPPMLLLCINHYFCDSFFIFGCEIQYSFEQG